MSSALLERYDERIAGVVSCYDRVVITGTLPTVCYADGMTRFLNAAHVRRYLEHLSALDDFSAGVRALGRVTRPRTVGDKTVKGINFFEPGDSALLHALQDPKVNIAGIRRGELIPDLGMFSPGPLSRQLRRLLDLGVIKRVTGTCRYYLTKAGRAATAAAERLTGCSPKARASS